MSYDSFKYCAERRMCGMRDGITLNIMMIDFGTDSISVFHCLKTLLFVS